MTPVASSQYHSSMTSSDGVLIRRNAIGAADLTILNQHVRQAPMTDSLVSDFESEAREGVVDWVLNTEIRATQEVQLTPAISELLRRIEDANVPAFVEPYYQVEVRDREPSQVLHYGVGGHYLPHVDAETLYKDDIGLDMWEKTLDRDLSVVYFLNDDFAGGELVFPALDLIVKPEAGTLVCFPSDHNYVHGVNPVTAGHRYSSVTWMRVKGMPSVDEINQMAMDEYHRRWPQQIEQPPRLAKGGVT